MVKLRMLLKFLPGFGAQGGLAIYGFPERFGAGGVADAAEPVSIEWFGDKVGGVGGDGGFLLFAGGMAGTDVKSGEQQGNAEHGAAGISGERAGTRGVEEPEEIGEERLGPHGRIFRGGKGVEQNGVRGRDGLGGWMSECVDKERRKIAEVKFPINCAAGVRELNCAFAKKKSRRRFFANR